MTQTEPNTNIHTHTQALEPSQATPEPEAADARVRRLYAADGGPLMGWLVDEAEQRGLSLQMLAEQLGVTYGYIAQLRNGYKSTANIGKPFAAACARFLGVPTAVVLVLSGFLTLRDFSTVAEPEEDMLNRSMRQLNSNKRLLATLCTSDLQELPFELKRLLVSLYSAQLTYDPFGHTLLPHMLDQLQRAALIHCERESP